MDRYSSALGAKQGFMERRTDSGPDYGAVAQYANQVGQAPITRTINSYSGYKTLPSLGGGGYTPTYAPGQSPVQLQLDARNKEARIEQEKRAKAAASSYAAPIGGKYKPFS